jgi:hypothetical protein
MSPAMMRSVPGRQNRFVDSFGGGADQVGAHIGKLFDHCSQQAEKFSGRGCRGQLLAIYGDHRVPIRTAPFNSDVILGPGVGKYFEISLWRIRRWPVTNSGKTPGAPNRDVGDGFLLPDEPRVGRLTAAEAIRAFGRSERQLIAWLRAPLPSSCTARDSRRGGSLKGLEAFPGDHESVAKSFALPLGVEKGLRSQCGGSGRDPDDQKTQF